MTKKLQNQQAVLSPANADKRVSTAHKTMPLAKAVWANVFILFLLLGFWRTGGAQPTANDRVQLFGQNDISYAFWHTPLNPQGARLGFELDQHFRIMNYQPLGSLYLGTNNQTRMFMDNTGLVGLSNAAPFALQSRLQVHENVPGSDNYLTLSNFTTTSLGGARLGQAGGAQDFRIEQFQPANIELWTGGSQRITLDPNGFVGIGTVTPTVELHVDGQVRFESLNFSAGIQQYLTWQPTGDIGWQTGIMPLPGANFGETLFWNGTEWQNTDFLTTVPGVGIGIDLPPGGSPLSKLHLDENAGFGNYALWTNLATTMGARIGQSGTTFQIIQDEPADIEFLVNTAPVAYINDQFGAGMPFMGVGTNMPLLPGINYVADPFAGGPTTWGWTGVATPPPTNPMFSVAGDISTPNDIFANTVYIASDERMKENITKLSDWKRIFEIQPYTYKYKEQGHNAFSYGFMAQDVYKTLPELTRGWGKALSVNYIGFIPFLSQGLKEHEERLNAIEQARENVLEAEQQISDITAKLEVLENQDKQFAQRFEALETENQNLNNEVVNLNSEVQHLKSQNEQLQNKLAVLEDKFNAICNLPCIQNNPAPNGNGGGAGKGFGQTGTLGEPPALIQNEPNPFSETTVIRYFLPEGAVNAKIEVRNVENKVVGSFSLSGIGHGNITLSAGTLAAGNYFYSLIINNSIIETKKMVLLK